MQFLNSLFECPDEVAHSDLVYTFFHPLLRDQEEANVHIRKLRGELVRVLREPENCTFNLGK